MNRYLVLEGDLVQGPFSFDELKYGKISSHLDASILVKKEGEANWRPLIEHPELAELIPNKKSNEDDLPDTSVLVRTSNKTSESLVSRIPSLNSVGSEDRLSDRLYSRKPKAPSVLKYILAWFLVFWIFGVLLNGSLLIAVITSNGLAVPDKFLILKGLAPIVSALISMIVFIMIYQLSFKELQVRKVLPYHLVLGLPLFILLTNNHLVEFDFSKDPIFLFMCVFAFIGTNILPLYFWFPSSSPLKNRTQVTHERTKTSKVFTINVLSILFCVAIAFFSEDLFKFINSDTKSINGVSGDQNKVSSKSTILNSKKQTSAPDVLPKSILELEQKARAVSADDWLGNVEAYTEALAALRNHVATQTSNFSGEFMSSPEARSYADLLQNKLKLYQSKIAHYKGLSKNSDLKQKYPFIAEIMPLVGSFWGYEAGIDVIRSQCADHGVDIEKFVLALERENEAVVEKIIEIDQNFASLDIASIEKTAKETSKKQILLGNIDFAVNMANAYSTTPKKLCSLLVANRSILVKDESFKVKFTSVYDDLMAI